MADGLRDLERFLPAPHRWLLDSGIDRAVDQDLFLLVSFYDTPDAVLDAGQSVACPLPLRRDQTYDLTASCDQIGQGLGFGIGP
ncbi:hypothetical protein BK022_24060 [Methylorubrum extorquens]|uniref:Uncharacterized protein n=1 Tax=Methylorubrum extorquens TaxID=408 RepID=A0A1S1NZD7_METEX|nr:hypothetical protein BK022_24060 [Methylorubrum extorquens]